MRAHYLISLQHIIADRECQIFVNNPFCAVAHIVFLYPIMFVFAVPLLVALVGVFLCLVTLVFPCFIQNCSACASGCGTHPIVDLSGLWIYLVDSLLR